MTSPQILISHLKVLDEFVSVVGLLVLICHAQVLQRLPKHGKGAYCVLQKLDSFANVLVMYRSIYQMMETPRPLLRQSRLHLIIMHPSYIP